MLMRRIFLFLFLFASLHTAAQAEEVIRSFSSNVEVATDGSLLVREIIIVKSEGNEIKRGIQRDFPTSYTDQFGQRVKVGFEVLDVKRDGQVEPWQTIYISNGERVRIGDKDVFLEDGEHTYQIDYRTTRQVGFFEKFDELYWNATGNGWTLPIESATAIIKLPSGAVIQNSAIYTGYFGEKGEDATIVLSNSNQFNAKTTQRLAANQGFSVAVSWQKGIVFPPTAVEKRMSWIVDNLGYFLLGLTLPLVGIYYIYAWSRVGRDPPGGIIVPLFHPPVGLGPAGVRYVWKQKFDDQGFAAALVGLAVKKRLRIADSEGEYTITRLDDDGEKLSRSEQALYDRLPMGSLALEHSNNVAVRRAQSGLSSALNDEYDGAMFLRNTGWFVVGAVISAIGMIVSGFLIPSGEGVVALFIAVFASVWWGVIIAVGRSAVKGAFGAGGLFTRIKSLMSILFLLPFVGAGIAVPSFIWLGGGVSWPLIIFASGAVLLLFFNQIFFWLLKAPTPIGRQILDQIEGFRMYMTTAEENRLDVLHPPEKTPALFERYLPYAMALDCENQWNAKFAAVLAAAAAAAGAVSAGPGWYHGRNWNSGSFSRDLNNGLTSSISSAAVAPGSSSGSSGGGFSGGGGGGGGGSGW